MAFKKTQNYLTIAKTKSEQIVEFIADVVHWSVLSEKLDYTRYKSFDIKKNVRNRYNELKEASEGKDTSAFDTLAEIFTIKELNSVIDIFNDYVEYPEKYEKPRKKKEIDLDKQEEAVKNSMKDFQSDLGYERGSVEVKDVEEQEQTNKKDKASKANTKEEVLEEHAADVKKQREAINKLPKGSKERAEKEAEFKHNKANRISEFWKNQNKDN